MPISPALLLLGANLVNPISATVPTLDVATSCSDLKNLGIANVQSYDTCMQEENAARADLVKTWQSFPASQQRSCATLASIGSASYVELLVCLQMAQEATAAENAPLNGAGAGAGAE
jgi:hypothetical protein